MENPSSFELFKKRATQVVSKQKQMILSLQKKLKGEIERRKRIEEDKVKEVESIRREVDIERMKNVQLSVELQKQNFTKKEIDTIQDMSVAEMQITQLKEQLKLEMTKANRKILEQEEKISTLEIQTESAKTKLAAQLEAELSKRVQVEKQLEIELLKKDEIIIDQKKELAFRESLIVEKMGFVDLQTEKINKLEQLVAEKTDEVMRIDSMSKLESKKCEESIAFIKKEMESLKTEREYLFTLTQDYDFVALFREVTSFKAEADKLTINEDQVVIRDFYERCKALCEKSEHLDRKLYDGLAEMDFILSEIENRLKGRIIVDEKEIAA